MAAVLWTLSGQCYSFCRVTILLLALILACYDYSCMSLTRQEIKRVLAEVNMAIREHYGQQNVELSRVVHPQPDLLIPPRRDVLVVTPWLAPIVWEGTFNIDILNQQFRQQNATIGLTVFAVKKYIIFLKLFLETAETYFMVGHRVNYYIFTDQPKHVPQILLQKGRQMAILRVQSYARWQDISMHRMEVISIFSQRRFLREVDYLVCADVDMKFNDHVGVEILSSLFGTIHPAYLGFPRGSFPYERRPQSQAYIPKDEGDFYYIGALFGGSVPEVYRLTKACHKAMMIDKAGLIEAKWHEESHLNKYLLHHKPTKVLSSEYMCDQFLLYVMWAKQLVGSPFIIKKMRVMVLPKNNSELRADEGHFQKGFSEE
ncbi:histo-blood group ABO system transferase-like [Tupaia chinensis]|uniref:histo-blood group ABO system transferase-like n=1 Tax=Tupaia chinensis TaxID=246437 RepID=UPI0003C8FC11|nr:histo-blood group ABO system transferase-like [Tupaia chinensis]